MSPLYSHPRTYCEKQGALDSDGDIARDLVQEGRAVLDPNWACYHTEMYDCKLGNTIVGTGQTRWGVFFGSHDPQVRVGGDRFHDRQTV